MPGETTRFRITGMDCAEEVVILRRDVGPLVGGEENLSFDILNGIMTVAPAAGRAIDQNAIAKSVETSGMTSTLIVEGGGISSGVNRPPSRIRTLTLISGVATLIGFLLQAILDSGIRAAFGDAPGVAYWIPLSARVVYLIAITAGVWQFVPKAIASARRLRPDMNLLMLIAAGGAIYLDEWLEAATVSFLFSLSLLLESWSIDRARRAVAALLNLSPDTVDVVSEDGKQKNVAVESVAVGTKFVVRAGQRFPLDGHVFKGTSDVNQAPLTGESVPVSKAVGDMVYAGTINGSGTLEVLSSKASGETTLAHIIRMVGEARSRRAPSEQWVDSFAKYYTPIVMVLALAIFLLGPMITGGPYDVWLYRALVLLVIACPCALVISTPVSIVAALAGATSRGILIKGGQFVEAPAHLKAIAFDKTGTLTLGKPTVTRVVPFQSHDERELLERAAALEMHSTHPLAVAVTDRAGQQGVTVTAADEFQVIPGKGATGKFGGRPFWIGSHRYLEERGQETPEVHEQITRLSEEGRSVVVIGNEDHVCGFIVLADTVRPAAVETLKRLRSLGISHLVMLSGDNRPTAETIATAVGVDEVQAELMPAEKVAAIEALVKKYQHVAMIGDGINDAPALAAATIGIAMGGIGSDAAIETADIALMGDDISQLPWLIAHSRRTLSIIRQNVTFSLAVKAAFLVLTLVGHASLWAAIAADTGASLMVIANGLRLLRSSPEGKS